MPKQPQHYKTKSNAAKKTHGSEKLAAITKKKQEEQQQHQQQSSSLYANNTDSTDLESQRCDVIDEFVLYEREMVRMENEIIPALANRSYHLPGNTYNEDIIQYFRNNHPIISICCHHVQHPIQFRMRLLQLFSSLVCGLTLTNGVWLWFYYSKSDEDTPFVTIPFGGSGTDDGTNGVSNNDFTITYQMIYLWTFGGAIHAIYDNTIWYISACVCCLSSTNLETYRKWGTYVIITIVMTFTTMATLALLLRSSAEEAQNDNDDGVVEISFHQKYVYEFLISYVTEFILALFIYYPIIAMVLFSGVCSCGFHIPVLGGRPYEVMMAERAYQKQQQQNNRRSSSTHVRIR